MFWHYLNYFSNLSEQEKDAVNHAEALEVVGGWENHVEFKMQVTAIKHSEEEQQYWLHKLLVYGELV